MTDEQIALARRAVACRGWRWMPGMLAVEWTAPGMSLTSGRPVRVDERWHEVGVWLPNLTDPATVGCLLAQLREAWGCVVIGTPTYEYDDEARQGRHPVGWRAVETALWATVGEGDTEAEALVAALEAAP